MLRDLPIALIDTRPDARVINEAAVEALAESIAAVGLINPIRVRAVGERWEVIAGAHRLAACTSLGLIDIAAVIVTDDDLHAELAMIDENLCRSELSPAERAKCLARRRDIYNELHNPLTGRGGNRRADQLPEGQKVDPSFAAQTAAATGMSERMVYKHIDRGAKVIDEVVDLIKGTPLDTGSFLDKIKDLPPNDQYKATERELARVRAQEREKNRSAKAAKIDAGVKARAAREVAEVISEYVPSEWWDAVKSNLYAAGAKHVADAFTNITGQSVIDRSAA